MTCAETAGSLQREAEEGAQWADADLPGRPDVVLPKWHAIVFVHGCFWHRHAGCPCFRLPKTRTGFWEEKLQKNHDRDTAAVTRLLQTGWRVAVVWECAARKDPDAAGRKLATWIKGGKVAIEVEDGGRTFRVAKLAIGVPFPSASEARGCRSKNTTGH
ncbi:MAG: hypothetical protein KGJ94_10960 [Xanthomonadaceae bacterium]|nr:hypothetical protein [Xanthomonadaceae bacterium]